MSKSVDSQRLLTEEQLDMESALDKSKWARQASERNSFREGWAAAKESTAALELRLERAERALQRAGFTYLDGADEWKPPKGKSPRFISVGLNDDVRSVLDMFMSLYRAKGWEGDLAYQRAEALLVGSTKPFDPRISETEFMERWPEIQKSGDSYGWLGIGLSAWRACLEHSTENPVAEIRHLAAGLPDGEVKTLVAALVLAAGKDLPDGTKLFALQLPPKEV